MPSALRWFPAVRRSPPLQYTNPELPQDVNVSEKHPLRDFLTLIFAVVVIAAAVAGALAFGAQWLAPRVPFETERRVVERQARALKDGGDVGRYLQSLADRLAREQSLPAGMTVRVHYQDDAIVNAFASLGGNIVVFRGLIDAVPDENALAMVMAHEIAHVKHRHPAQALGRGLAFGVVLSVVSAAAGSSIASTLLGDAGLLTVLSFNRVQEEEADATALAALSAVYGHVGGAGALFDVLRERAGSAQPPKLLSSHPLTDDRIARIAALAAQRGWPLEGIRTPLPEAVRKAVRGEG